MIIDYGVKRDIALNAAPAARRLFDALDSANRFAILFRIHQTKAPKNAPAKLAELVAMLDRGETIHPRRSRRGWVRRRST